MNEINQSGGKLYALTIGMTPRRYDVGRQRKKTGKAHAAVAESRVK